MLDLTWQTALSGWYVLPMSGNAPLARLPSNWLMASRAERGRSYSSVATPVDRPERSYYHADAVMKEGPGEVQNRANRGVGWDANVRKMLAVIVSMGWSKRASSNNGASAVALCGMQIDLKRLTARELKPIRGDPFPSR